MQLPRWRSPARWKMPFRNANEHWTWTRISSPDSGRTAPSWRIWAGMTKRSTPWNERSHCPVVRASFSVLLDMSTPSRGSIARSNGFSTNCASSPAEVTYRLSHSPRLPLRPTTSTRLSTGSSALSRNALRFWWRSVWLPSTTRFTAIPGSPVSSPKSVSVLFFLHRGVVCRVGLGGAADSSRRSSHDSHAGSSHHGLAAEELPTLAGTIVGRDGWRSRRSGLQPHDRAVHRRPHRLTAPAALGRARRARGDPRSRRRHGRRCRLPVDDGFLRASSEATRPRIPGAWSHGDRGRAVCDAEPDVF